MLYHFYHCYVDGKWEIPVSEHIEALKASGLYGKLDKFFIGIVGNSQKRNELINFLNNLNIEYEICAQAESGWEQVTLNELYNFSQSNDGCVLYCHTKASNNTTEHGHAWRRGMTDFNIGKWEKYVPKLYEYDAIGGWWTNNGSTRFFAGTFWWSTFDLIRKLGPPSMSDPWCAETWIGNYPEIIVYDWVNDL